MKGLRFRETMTGRVALRTADPVDGYQQTHAVAAVLRAEIAIPDVRQFVDAERHRASLQAEMVIPVLGGRFVASDGEFVCFERGDGPNGRPVQQLLYTATLINNDRRYRMQARKILEPGWPWEAWRDTTTLHVVLTDTTPPSATDPDTQRPEQAAGLIRLTGGDFLRQLTTTEIYGDIGRLDRPKVFLTYAVFFLKGLAKTYLLGARW